MEVGKKLEHNDSLGNSSIEIAVGRCTTGHWESSLSPRSGQCKMIAANFRTPLIIQMDADAITPQNPNRNKEASSSPREGLQTVSAEGKNTVAQKHSLFLPSLGACGWEFHNRTSRGKHVLSTCQQAGMDPTRRTTSGLPSFFFTLHSHSQEN